MRICHLIFCCLICNAGFGQLEYSEDKIFPVEEQIEMPSIYLYVTDSISKDQKSLARIKIEDFEGHCGIELHGNSTLYGLKKSYGIEFSDSEGYDSTVTVLDFAPGEDFVLLANFYDQSFIRNAFAFRLWEKMGHYVPRYRYCKLYLNEEYQGLYMLVEKIRGDENHLNLGQPARVGHWQLHDPFLLKIDWENDGLIHGVSSIFGRAHYSRRLIKAKLIYPKLADYTWQYKGELQDHLEYFDQQFMESFYPDQYSRIAINSDEKWSGIDLMSFVDFFLVNELSKNPDAYRSSTYFHKASGGEVRMGPIWDYDLAFANTLNVNDNDADGWIYNKELSKEKLQTMPNWWYYLMCDDQFKNLCIQRLNELDKLFPEEEIDKFFRGVVSEIKDEVLHDVNRWGANSDFELDVQGPLQATLEERLIYISRFYNSRRIWIEENIEKEPCVTTYSIAQKHKEMKTFYPNASKENILVEFGFDATSHHTGGRYNYFMTSSYVIRNEQIELMGSGSATGKSKLVNCKDWPKGTYYFYLTQSDQSMATFSAVSPDYTLEYRLVIE